MAQPLGRRTGVPPADELAPLGPGIRGELIRLAETADQVGVIALWPRGGDDPAAARLSPEGLQRVGVFQVVEPIEEQPDVLPAYLARDRQANHAGDLRGQGAGDGLVERLAFLDVG